ncbi:MAG TPA: hypothetical protein VLV82_01415 [Candidatus Angelobacter sp.]|nr:hypothetical protein [Candidatus Angelobacter sp.]
MTLSGGLVAACAGRTDVPPSASAPASAGTGVPPTTPVPATSPTAARPSATAAAPALPAARPWVARAGEVQPSVKERATSLIEAVGSWTGGAGDLTHARARAEAAGHPSSLVDALAPLLGPEPSAVTIVRDAQYGGILSSSASVLVVADQWRARSDGHVTPGGTTLDVRLVAAVPRWRVVDVFPARPGKAAATLSPAARKVLSDKRIRLPYAARSDVLSGNVHDSVLGLLAAMAREHVVDVSVIRSGHPLYVFGTSRTSDHPRGRAVDVWALDERPLVLPSNHSLAASAMRYAVAHGAYNVGGPVLLAGSAYFTNRTHQDHIHLGLPG